MEIETRTNIFEQATRLQIRYAHKGACSVEDLWELPLSSLDGIFKKLSGELRNQQEDSLLVKKSKENEVLLLKIAVIRHIVKTKIDEATLQRHNMERARRKQKLLGIKADKQDEALKGMTMEELDNLIDEL